MHEVDQVHEGSNPQSVEFVNSVQAHDVPIVIAYEQAIIIPRIKIYIFIKLFTYSKKFGYFGFKSLRVNHFYNNLFNFD